MKSMLVNIGILAVAIQFVSAQAEGENEIENKNIVKTKHGIEYSRFSSASGFRANHEIHFTAQSSAKAKIGFGLFLDGDSKKFSGFTMTYQRFFMSKREKLPFIQPFLVYNFIYRKTSMPALKETNEMNKISEIATYTSLEHHIGMGFNVNISKSLVLGNSLGYGIYLGSIKRPSQPDPITKEIAGSNGSGWLFKTGIGFTF